MTKSKKIRMPASIRNKLMAAITMLLVSSIMMVSTTYAWFTLSTAPEVKGMQTTVGANGNLEIALLTTGTYADPTTISSAAGDSYVAEGKSLQTANITWGNLVDVSTGYGLTNVVLKPASLNLNSDALVSTAPLKTPVYGPDGRVAEVTAANTVSAAYNSTNSAFTYDGTQTYGVRAVGISSTITPRQISFNGARSSFTSSVNAAESSLKEAVSKNINTLLILAGMDEDADYTAAQIAGMKDMATRLSASLNSIVAAYAKAALAAAASNSTIEDTAFFTLESSISSITDAAALKTALNAASIDTYDAVLDTLTTSQSEVADVISTLDTYAEGTNNAAGRNAVETAIGKLYDSKTNESGENVTRTVALGYMSTGGQLYISGAAIGAIADQLGKTQLVSYPAGTNSIVAYAGTYNQADDGALATMATTVGGLPAPGGSSTANITDTYGYVLDFAFRTNVANSYLQLQTTAVNRVSSDTTDTTMGAGSTVTFTYDANLTDTQATTLLGAIKLVFFNPADGTILANAKLSSITAGSNSATASVILDVAEGADADNIVSLDANTAKLVSVLVYLDGENIQNDDVANAASSGTLTLNLQFSSSATLQPMDYTNWRTTPVTPAAPTPDATITAGGAAVTLTASQAPSGATVTWSSSDTDVATVADGTVTGLAEGTVIITASWAADSGAEPPYEAGSQTFTVQVTAAADPGAGG